MTDQRSAAPGRRCLRVPPMPCPDPSCRETGVCFEQRRARDAANNDDLTLGDIEEQEAWAEHTRERIDLMVKESIRVGLVVDEDGRLVRFDR